MAFNGFCFCITGKFSMDRKALEALCKANGATTAGSVTKKVTHLLCEDSSTSKAAKAESMGIPVHDEAWVHAQIGGGGSKKKATKAPAKKAPAKKAPKKKAPVAMDEEDEELDTSSMSVGELKAALKARGLPVSGKKADLADRLNGALGGGDDEAEEDEEELDPSSMSVGELKAALKARGLKATGKKSDLADRLAGALGGGDDEEEDEPAPAPKKKAATKRKAAAPAAKAAKKPAKKAKTGSRKVDDLCPLGGAAVHEDFDCMLNQTNINANNNKFYIVQLVVNGGSYYCWTRWGRVGENGQNALKGPMDFDGALKEFKKKFRDKTKNKWEEKASFTPHSGKYTLIEMDDGDEEDEDDLDAVLSELAESKSGGKVAKCTLPKETQDLVKLIFDNDMFKNAMKSMEIDVKKMPLGKLSKQQLAKGNACLTDLDAAIKSGSRKKMEEVTSRFYTLIPHSFGRVRPPVIDDDESLQRKFDLLAVLGDIEQAQNLLAKKKSGGGGGGDQPHPLDANYGVLKSTITPLDKKSKEFKIIETYSNNTQGRSAKLLEVFKVERHGEEKRFAKYKNLGNRKLLWHGTNVAVVVACLSGGLRIMPHSGGRVGKGIYFASEHGKSANYVRTDSKGTGIMFLSEVALGKEHHITRDDWRLTQPPAGKDCIIAQGHTEPDPSKDTTLTIDGNEVTVPQAKPKSRPEYTSSYFSQTEYLVYNEAQNRIRYMLKYKF